MQKHGAGVEKKERKAVRATADTEPLHAIQSNMSIALLSVEEMPALLGAESSVTIEGCCCRVYTSVLFSSSHVDPVHCLALYSDFHSSKKRRT
jgi:hypothetical protein